MAMDKTGLKGRIEAELVAQGFVITGVNAYASKMAEAIANAVIDEIVENSELVPITTDQGTAGAGIITGKVM